ncbi:MAG: energy transducer TonB [Terriglobales bacterium]|jgi:hypothetical protein
MKFKLITSAFIVTLSLSANAQQGPLWPCGDQVAVDGPPESSQSASQVRVSAGVTDGLAKNRVLPDISDLWDEGLDATVVIGVAIDREGNVRCARFERGDEVFAQRSIAAAEKWTFKPYTLNGQAVAIESQIVFTYKKDEVEAR